MSYTWNRAANTSKVDILLFIRTHYNIECFRYHLRKEQLIEESRKEEEESEFRTQQQQSFGRGYFAQKRKKIWDLVEKPNSSPYAKVRAILVFPGT